MSDSQNKHSGESGTAKKVGWAFVLVLIAHSVLISIMPRLEKESAIREAARGWHYLMGTALLVSCRLASVAVVSGPRGAGARHTAAASTLLASVDRCGDADPDIAIRPRSGFSTVGPRDVRSTWRGWFRPPSLVGKDHAIWQFAGYFHSALANGSVLIALVAVLSAAYTLRSVRKGPVRRISSGIRAPVPVSHDDIHIRRQQLPRPNTGLYRSSDLPWHRGYILAFRACDQER